MLDWRWRVYFVLFVIVLDRKKIMKPKNFPARKEARRLAANMRIAGYPAAVASGMLEDVAYTIRMLRTKKVRVSKFY